LYESMSINLLLDDLHAKNVFPLHICYGLIDEKIHYFTVLLK